MKNVLSLLVLLVLVSGMSGNALAVDTDWNNADGDRRWDNANNWGTGVVPTADDKAAVRNDGIGPIIDSSTTAVALQLPVGDQGRSGALDITGGSLTTSGWFIVGYNAEGIFNVSGGTTTVVGGSTDMTVGRAGTGHLNISDGSIEVGDKLYVGREAAGTGYITMTGGLITINDDLYAQLGTTHINVSGGVIDIAERIFLGNGAGGEAHLTMTGGSITLGQLMAVGRQGASGDVHLDGGTLDIGEWLEMSDNASIDITGGTLIIDGDRISDGVERSIMPFINDGRIAAYGGNGTLYVDYDSTNSGKTTLTARLDKAMDPYPADGAKGVLLNEILSWRAPRGIVNTDIADPNVVSFVVFCDPNEALINAATYDSHVGVTFYSDQVLVGDIATDPIQEYIPASELIVNTTYYWRVDTRFDTATGPNDVVTGKVWMFNTNLMPSNVAAAHDLVPAVDGVPVRDGLISVAAYNPYPDGGALTYKWYLDPDPATSGDEVALSDGADYSGVLTADLTVLSPATGYPSTGDEGFYVCEVSNGGGTTLSSPGRLAIARRVNHYMLDGDLVDSASGYDATLFGGGTVPTWPAGKVGTAAIELDGTNAALIDMTSPYPYPSTGEQFTITAWVYADNTNTWSTILKHWNGSTTGGLFHFGIGQEDNLDLQIEQADGTGVRVSDYYDFPTGEWQFVAAVADGSQIRMYRIGTEITSRHFEAGLPDQGAAYVGVADYDGTLNISSTQWAAIGCKPAEDDGLGTPPAPNGGFWNGKLDDIQVYNYGMTAQEVAAVYGSRVCLYSKDPMPAWLDLDIDNDCEVNLGDFAALAAEWLNGGIYTP